MLFSNTVLGQMAPTVVERARRQLEEHFTSTLQSQVREAGWPEDIARSLAVVQSDEGFGVDIPEPFESRAYDIEYGTPGQPPKATIRQFRKRISDAEDPEVSNSLLEALSGGVL